MRGVVLGHALVFVAQLANMLGGVAVVVEECGQPRGLFFLLLLLAEDVEFQLHEVDLLLQVVDVLIFHVGVGVGPEWGVERLA